jgi:hypothetical protein
MAANVTFCAIRWDPWHEQPANSWVTRQVINNLSDPDFQSRAPFWATQRGTNLLGLSYSQNTMDQEIAAANAGNVHVWAFLRYVNREAYEPGMENGLALYKSSVNKGALKWVSIEGAGSAASSTGSSATRLQPTYVPRLITEMQRSDYFKLATGNRPVVMWYALSESELISSYGSLATAKTNLFDYIRAQAIAAGLGNPYFIIMSSSTAFMTALGMDAVSNYIGDIADPLDGAFSLLDTSLRAYWDSLKAVGKMVPICMAGWSRGPRIRRYAERPYMGERRKYECTPAELATHVQAAVDYVNANPVDSPSRLIICYAWDEFDEGGRLCPTLGDPPTALMPGGARLAALAPVLA